MGDNARKGYTYTYFSGSLQDAQGTVTPRPFLAALAAALTSTGRNHPEHDRPLHYDDLRHGVRCGARAEELHQALPWARLTLEPLAGQRVPISEEEVFGLWESAELEHQLKEPVARAAVDGLVRTGPRSPASYPLLLEELVGAGVLSRRTSGQVDMPDVYRIPYGLGRRGGVRRTRPAA
ncbi:hypothetical protein ACIQC7_35435 [Kitasatospora sp. NPDC088556]|uniref:hypothetical protein n=1 Tax=Kitasatospora sp. NPDC088556 TaxID=3364076 RepID=UPI0038065425